MDKAETKEYLYKSIVLKNKIDQLKQKKKDLFSVSCGAIDYSRASVQTSKRHDQIESIIVKADELDKKIDNLTYEYVKLKDDLINEIHQLDEPLYINILYYKYIKGYSMQQISKLCTHENRYGQRVHYEYKHICKAHNKALEAFAEMKDRIFLTGQ